MKRGVGLPQEIMVAGFGGFALGQRLDASAVTAISRFTCMAS
ncbi:hypothetical protein RGAI101_894 [Roseobacter sp. GAI101]|nr:hypothetical protein RGAI101_894 [Roseobacter sp. GAI101]